MNLMAESSHIAYSYEAHVDTVYRIIDSGNIKVIQCSEDDALATADSIAAGLEACSPEFLNHAVFCILVNTYSSESTSVDQPDTRPSTVRLSW